MEFLRPVKGQACTRLVRIKNEDTGLRKERSVCYVNRCTDDYEETEWTITDFQNRAEQKKNCRSSGVNLATDSILR
jgi:hypothetical protein